MSAKDLYGCEKEIRRLEADLVDLHDQLEAEKARIDFYRLAVAVALTELNTRKGEWGRPTATNMIRQALRNEPVIQEFPLSQRPGIRDLLLPPLAKKP